MKNNVILAVLFMRIEAFELQKILKESPLRKSVIIIDRSDFIISHPDFQLNIEEKHVKTVANFVKI